MSKAYPSIDKALFPIYEILLKMLIKSYQDFDYFEYINKLIYNLSEQIKNDFFSDSFNRIDDLNNNTEVLIPEYFTKVCKERGIKKYIDLYEKVPDLSKSDNFFAKINFLFINFTEPPKVYFSEDSVKVIALHRGNKFSINYDYGYDDSLFISLDTGKKLIVKECNIDSVLQTLESYFELPEVITSAA